jgi:hypothetical protein
MGRQRERILMTNIPVMAAPADAPVEPVLVARDQLVCCALALVAAVRTSRLIATDVDAVVVANAALEQMGFSYRLQPLH